MGFNKNGERLVGQTAKRQAVVNPENTIYSIKRFMGRRFDEVQTERKMVSFNVVEGPAGDARIEVPITNKDYSPQEISAMILGKLKKDDEAYYWVEHVRPQVDATAWDWQVVLRGWKQTAQKGPGARRAKNRRMRRTSCTPQ